MSNKIEDRADRIMQTVLKVGEISVWELTDQIGTSASNIRRDLTRLEKRGLVLRTRGGATLVDSLYEPFRHDKLFQESVLRPKDEERRIGWAASELIIEKETVGLMPGTITTQIGRSLRHRRRISVVTNALNIGMELCNRPEIKVTMTGGTLGWVWSFALVGQPALNALKEVYLDKVFISATGVDMHRGVTTLEPEAATVSQAMIRQSKEVIVVADSSKIGKVSSAFICPITDVHVLVTDYGITHAVHEQLTERAISVIRA